MAQPLLLYIKFSNINLKVLSMYETLDLFMYIQLQGFRVGAIKYMYIKYFTSTFSVIACSLKHFVIPA